MARIYQNFLGGETDAALTDVATSLSSPALAALQAVASPDTMLLVLDPDGIAGEPEVVTVTAHTAAATTATITRATSGTTARAHASGIEWSHGPLASDLGVWTDYTPVWTSSGTAPAIGNGTLSGRYVLHGKTCHFTIALTFGSTTTTGSGSWSFGFPVTPSFTLPTSFLLTGYLEDLATVGYGYLGARASSATEFYVQFSSGTNGQSNIQGAAVPFTMATGDYLSMAGTYEVA